MLGVAAAALLLAVPLVMTLGPSIGIAQAVTPIKQRNISVSREEANKQPRSEKDQTIVEGWPLYRNERGQQAFNDTMATMRATDGPVPTPQAFRGCKALECGITLPAIDADGWIPAGRMWVSPSEYVLFVQSERDKGADRRRNQRAMKVFVFHEFHNSSFNTDVFDTISSHRGRVFVPFYMGKSGIDGKGRRFVAVVQVAPYDVVSVHATVFGSAGPGIEVARNKTDPVDPLQNLAGILVATMVKAAAPQLKVVNHRGSEGLPMLTAYQRRLELVAGSGGARALALPFVPADDNRIASVTGRLDQLVRRGDEPPRAVAEQPRATAVSSSPALVAPITQAYPPSCAKARVLDPTATCHQRLSVSQ